MDFKKFFVLFIVILVSTNVYATVPVKNAYTNVPTNVCQPNDSNTGCGAATGAGTVTSVSVVTANGLAGTVATATTTPAITLKTSVTGLLKGNGTAISAATGDTDYQNPISLTTTGSSGAASFIGDVLNIPQYSGGSSQWTTVNTNDVFLPNSGNIGLGTNLTSTAALSVMNGNVGIGTWIPQSGLQVGSNHAGSNQTLTVYGNVGVAGTVFLNQPNSPPTGLAVLSYDGGPATLFNKTGSNIGAKFYIAGTQEMNIDQTSGNIGIGTSTTARARLDVTPLNATASPFVVLDSGNVGVGSVGPIQKLDIAGTARMTGFNLSTTPSSGYVLTSDTNGNGSWLPVTGGSGSGTVGNGTIGQEAVYTGATTVGSGVITDTGTNVGIGSLSPGQNLDVKGTVRISGNVGIAGAAPTSALNVNGAVQASSFGITGTSDSYQSAAISFTNTNTAITNLQNTAGANTTMTCGAGTAGGCNFKTTSGVGSSDSYTFSSGNNGAVNDMTILSAGNVGVGTPVPNGKLDVEGASPMVVQGNLGIGTTIGAVGIGTYSPTLGFVEIKPSTNTPIGMWALAIRGNNNGTSVAGADNSNTLVTNSNSQGFADYEATNDLGPAVNVAGFGMSGSTANSHNTYPGAAYIYTTGATPFAISAHSDTNTIPGIIVTTSNNVGIGTFGPTTAQLFEIGNQLVDVTPTGNVGIGSISPHTALDVKGTARMTGFTMTTSPSSGYVLTSNATGDGSWSPATGGAGSGTVNSGTTGQAAFYSTGGTAVSGTSNLIFSGANIGISTATPGALMDIRGTVRIIGANVAASATSYPLQIVGNDPGTENTSNILIANSNSAGFGGIEARNDVGSFFEAGIAGSTATTNNSQPNIGYVITTGVSPIAIEANTSNNTIPGITISPTNNIGIGTFGNASQPFEIGHQQLDIMPNGNIGIGTINPVNAIEVKGSLAGLGYGVQGENLDASGYGYFASYSAAGKGVIIASTGSGFSPLPSQTAILTDSGENLNFGNNALTVYETMDTNGNVGIGTTIPNNRFVVKGSITQQWGTNIPVISSCGGGTPSVKGTDNDFQITVGTVATGCTASFGGTYQDASCTVSNQSMSITSALGYTVSKTAIVISQDVGLSSDLLNVHCGFKN